MLGHEAKAVGPGPGDFSVCVGCGEMLRYEPDLTLRRASSSEILTDLDAEGRSLIQKAQETIRELVKNRQRALDYKKQLQQMLANAKRWLADNPAAEVKVQFNFPGVAFVVAPISQALDKSLVSANEAGVQLIKAMWPWNIDSEPTVMMVRAVLDCHGKASE